MLPYLTEHLQGRPGIPVSNDHRCALSTEEVAYILDKKVDSSEVKQLMLEAEKIKAGPRAFPPGRCVEPIKE